MDPPLKLILKRGLGSEGSLFQLRDFENLSSVATNMDPAVFSVVPNHNKSESSSLEALTISKKYLEDVKLEFRGVNMKSAVFTNNVEKKAHSLNDIIMPMATDTALKELSTENVDMKAKKKISISSKRELKLQKKESYLQMKEAIIKIKEANLKCRENILKIKEANLLARESKLLAKENKVPKDNMKSYKEPNTQKKKNIVSKSMRKCNICNKNLKYKSWTKHMRDIHSPTTFVCHCKRFFHQSSMYDRHMQQAHKGDNELPKTVSKTGHQCLKCGTVFEHLHNLKFHMNYMHNDDGNTIYCDQCDMKLESLRCLDIHKRKVHYGEDKKYACDICGKKFTTQQHVLVHIQNSHENHGLSEYERTISENEDWHIESEGSYGTLNANNDNDWHIKQDNENLDVGAVVKNSLRHQMTIEFDDDVHGYTLKEVSLSPRQSYNIEMTKEVKLEHM